MKIGKRLWMAAVRVLATIILSVNGGFLRVEEQMSHIVEQYLPFIAMKKENFDCIGTSDFPLPKFPFRVLFELCNSAIIVLDRDEVLMKLTGNFIVVGDLHGNIRDLLRIFSLAGNPLENRYIFMGDYVDRGAFSIEVVVLLLALKVLRPKDIFLLRGNHEFEDINTIYGFKEQVLAEYNIDLYDKMNEVFSYLPLACTINVRTFVVHGGLSSRLHTIDQIKEIPKPSKNYIDTQFNDLVTDIMWSDPTSEHKHFFPSLRGSGTLFGISAIKNFLNKNHLTRIIRAHQCVHEGIEQFFCDKLFTVFSSSNYSSGIANRSGILRINDDDIHCFNFAPLKMINREHCAFKSIKIQGNHSTCAVGLSSTSPKYEQACIKPRRHSFIGDAMIDSQNIIKQPKHTFRTANPMPRPAIRTPNPSSFSLF